MALSDAQREHLARRLQEERERALSILNRSFADRASSSEEEQAGDLSSLPFHPADRGTDTMDDELAASNETRISRELVEIDAALERLYRTPEKYGVCEDTGRSIPFERLDVIPWARTCEKEGEGPRA